MGHNKTNHRHIFFMKLFNQLELALISRNVFRSLLLCGCAATSMPAKIIHAQVVKRLLDKGELISKTIEDVAETKAEATEHVVFMVVVGIVLSVALIAAALYFRGSQHRDA